MRVLVIALVCLLLVALLFVILMSTSFSDVEYYEVCSLCEYANVNEMRIISPLWNMSKRSDNCTILRYDYETKLLFSSNSKSVSRGL